MSAEAKMELKSGLEPDQLRLERVQVVLCQLDQYLLARVSLLQPKAKQARLM